MGLLAHHDLEAARVSALAFERFREAASKHAPLSSLRRGVELAYDREQLAQAEAEGCSTDGVNWLRQRFGGPLFTFGAYIEVDLRLSVSDVEALQLALFADPYLRFAAVEAGYGEALAHAAPARPKDAARRLRIQLERARGLDDWDEFLRLWRTAALGLQHAIEHARETKGLEFIDVPTVDEAMENVILALDDVIAAMSSGPRVRFRERAFNLLARHYLQLTGLEILPWTNSEGSRPTGPFPRFLERFETTHPSQPLGLNTQKFFRKRGWRN